MMKLRMCGKHAATKLRYIIILFHFYENTLHCPIFLSSEESTTPHFNCDCLLYPLHNDSMKLKCPKPRGCFSNVALKI